MNAIFVGLGASAVSWYRCALPARALGADWIGTAGAPADLRLRTGEIGRPLTAVEDLRGYDVVVLQQPRGSAWLRVIRDLQASGTCVLFEIDDYVQGVRKASGHGAADGFDGDDVKALELCMRASDGVLCATGHLASRYRAFNRRVWVCENGLDLGRYALTRPPREGVTIGWAGGTGHRPAMVPWLRELLGVLAERPATHFTSIGAEDFAAPLAERFGPERCRHLPWGPLEAYPAAMCNLDIALAPAGRSAFFRGKSDLRWLEASALGIPVVADPEGYPAIEDGVTGLHARTPAEARAAILRLVDDARLRERIGAAAREHVHAHRSIHAVAPQWARALDEARSLPVAA